MRGIHVITEAGEANGAYWSLERAQDAIQAVHEKPFEIILGRRGIDVVDQLERIWGHVAEVKDDKPVWHYTRETYPYAAEGTSLRGHLYATYDQLVELFGKPKKKTGKVHFEWILRDAKRNIVTIYDWKTPYPERIPDMAEFYWAIGGNNDVSAFSLIAYVEEVMSHE